MTAAEQSSLVEYAMLLANDAPTPGPTTIGRVARLLAAAPQAFATNGTP